MLTRGKHPMMAIFEKGRCPKYQDDNLVRVDLVYSLNKETNVKTNVVRFESMTYGSFNDKNVYKWSDKIHDVKKQMILIRRFCVHYQENNVEYSKTSNNCRKFMIELCGFLNIPCDEAMFFEEFWYKGRAWTEHTKQADANTTCMKDESGCVLM